MTIQEIKDWSSTRGLSVRGVMRGSEFQILPNDSRTDFPDILKVLHWLIEIGDHRYALSPSDMEKVLEGKLDLEYFVKSAHSRSRADS